MRIERRHVRRESSGELEQRKRDALEAGRERYPDATVNIAAYYNGTFYVEVRREGERVAEVVAV